MSDGGKYAAGSLQSHSFPSAFPKYFRAICTERSSDFTAYWDLYV